MIYMPSEACIALATFQLLISMKKCYPTGPEPIANQFGRPESLLR